MNTSETEFRDYVYWEIDNIKAQLNELKNKINEKVWTDDVNQIIDQYLSLYDTILSKVSEKYKTMDIRLKKDIATTIFIRLMQK